MDVYKKGSIRPTVNLKVRILLLLYSISPFNKISYLRNSLLRSLHLPLSTSITKGFFCLSYNLSVGENTGLGDTYIQNIAMVTIGENCSFSYRNMILTGTHDISDYSTIIAKPVVIGDNTWITSNVTILPGVTIGSNTIIGAGSVVSRDIPSGVFAAGNPCRVIKRIDFRK
ncbi:acyltransferase [Bacteroides caccae]|uniref:acyltransferase n=1 Tax=Bacteroides caccae TaxID=47678 RepID=UPI0011066AE2|nr:DapH/DapD/GlmU-related protein [Bacteroides caccae]